MIHLRILQYYVARARYAYSCGRMAETDLFLRYAMGEANKVKRADFTSKIFCIRNRLRRLTKA